METPSHSVIDRAGAEVPLPKSVGDLAIFLDVDGSLIDIAETPDSVVIPQDLPGALEHISEAASGALSLVSGRSLETLDRFFAPAKLTAIGLHGGEIRLPNGRVQLAPIPPILETLRPQLTALVDRHPGAASGGQGALAGRPLSQGARRRTGDRGSCRRAFGKRRLRRRVAEGQDGCGAAPRRGK